MAFPGRYICTRLYTCDSSRKRKRLAPEMRARKPRPLTCGGVVRAGICQFCAVVYQELFRGAGHGKKDYTDGANQTRASHGGAAH